MELDFSEKNYNILQGDVLDRLKDLDDCSVNCIITSPPYFNLRDYHMDGQIGMENTPEQYIQKMVEVFREARRVLKDDGTLWVNIGDSYCNTNGFARASKEFQRKGREDAPANDRKLAPLHEAGYKDKDLIGIPWMLAFAMRADGWYLRQDIIWCLSEATNLYVKDENGHVRPMSIGKIAERGFEGMSLWNGEEWTAIASVRKSDDPRPKIDVVLGNGETISTTQNHRWILEDGTEVESCELQVGDVLKRCDLPDVHFDYPFRIPKDVMWLAGMFIACGERYSGGLVFRVRPSLLSVLDRIENVARAVGGDVEVKETPDETVMTVYSDVLLNDIGRIVTGNSPSDKGLGYRTWNLPNDDLRCIMSGYFNGLGYGNGSFDGIKIPYVQKNHFWRTNLRALAARLGAFVVVKWTGPGKVSMTWHERRLAEQNDDCRVVRIKESRLENFYDITVDCESHLYALSNGVLTHNCKPNPLPESVSDRCTKAHEYIFLFSKSKQYYFDYEAIEEEATGYDGRKDTMLKGSPKYENADIFAGQRPQSMAARGHERWKFKTGIKFGGTKYPGSESGAGATYSGHEWEQKYKNLQYDGQAPHSFHKSRAMGVPDQVYPVRRKRDVWNVPTKSYSGAHFATFPEKLIEPCVLAGCPEGGVVLDVFNGAATTGVVALKHGRKYVGIELNPEYVQLSKDRLDKEFYDPEWLF